MLIGVYTSNAPLRSDYHMCICGRQIWGWEFIFVCFLINVFLGCNCSFVCVGVLFAEAGTFHQCRVKENSLTTSVHHGNSWSWTPFGSIQQDLHVSESRGEQTKGVGKLNFLQNY